MKSNKGTIRKKLIFLITLVIVFIAILVLGNTSYGLRVGGTESVSSTPNTRVRPETYYDYSTGQAYTYYYMRDLVVKDGDRANSYYTYEEAMGFTWDDFNMGQQANSWHFPTFRQIFCQHSLSDSGADSNDATIKSRLQLGAYEYILGFTPNAGSEEYNSVTYDWRNCKLLGT